MKSLSLALIACALAATPCLAQPPAQPGAGDAPAAVPSAPVPQGAPAADPFPPANPRYFTARSPSVDTVNAFLKSLWGYDANRLWRVMAVQATPSPGVSKIVVFITDKGPNAKVQSTTFYVMPDGKHALAEGAGIVPFGADPFTDLNAMLRQRATGATRGPAAKDLELIEFADLQCPHCKEAQSTMDQLAKDFPNAHIVFQLFPLTEIHPSAFKAAAYGVCVQKESNDAFFRYASAVFDTQDTLAPATEDTVLKAAVTRAGLDPAKIAACAATPAVKDLVNADIQLAEDAGVDQTPLLAVNGRMLPVGQISYEQLKQIITFQEQMDHVPGSAAAPAPQPGQ